MNKMEIKHSIITCPKGHKARIVGINLPKPEENYRDKMMRWISKIIRWAFRNRIFILTQQTYISDLCLREAKDLEFFQKQIVNKLMHDLVNEMLKQGLIKLVKYKDNISGDTVFEVKVHLIK